MKNNSNNVQDNPGRGAEPTDPLASFLSDPESHLSDVLYIYFRIYKKKLLWSLMAQALAGLKLKPSEFLALTDVGASMGFDTLYLLRRMTNNFSKPLPFDKVMLSLIEGDASLIAAGEQTFASSIPAASRVEFCYYHYPLIESLPLQDSSQHLALCSEVVEHLEEPGNLLREIFRILRPGGFFILTTDNSPSLLQQIRRIPVWFRGGYREAYARPSKESETVGHTSWNGRDYPIYGHINLNPTRYWEKLCKQAGFDLAAYGTYESIRRGGGSKSPLLLAAYFGWGAVVHHLMPRFVGRFFGDTTALLLRKPAG